MSSHYSLVSEESIATALNAISTKPSNELFFREMAGHTVEISYTTMKSILDVVNPSRYGPIHVLSFCGYEFLPGAIDMLADFLSKATALQTLEMSFCGLSPENTVTVLDALVRCDGVMGKLRVNFGYNKLLPTVGAQIAEILSRRPGRILSLNLRSTQLSASAVGAIIAANTGLTYLDVSFTQMVSPFDEMFHAIEKNSELRTLRLCGINFTPEESAEFRRVTVMNPISKIQDPSLTVCPDKPAVTTSTTTTTPTTQSGLRPKLMDVTNRQAAIATAPDDSVPKPTCGSPHLVRSVCPTSSVISENPQNKNYAVVPCNTSNAPGAVVESVQVAQLERNMSKLNDENRMLRKEVTEMKEMLKQLLVQNQERSATAMVKEQPAAALPRRSVTPPNRRCIPEPVVIPVRNRSPTMRSPTFRSTSNTRRNTIVVETNNTARSGVTSTGRTSRGSTGSTPVPSTARMAQQHSNSNKMGSSYNSNVSKQPTAMNCAQSAMMPSTARPSSRLVGTTQIRPYMTGHQQRQPHLQPFGY